MLGAIHKLRRQNFSNIWPSPSPLRRQVYNISLCSNIGIWPTPPPPSSAYVVYGWSLMYFHYSSVKFCMKTYVKHKLKLLRIGGLKYGHVVCAWRRSISNENWKSFARNFYFIVLFVFVLWLWRHYYMYLLPWKVVLKFSNFFRNTMIIWTIYHYKKMAWRTFKSF